MEIAWSVRGVPIRLTEERWAHIVENHDELTSRREEVLQAIESPAWVTRGYNGALVAWKPLRRGRYLSVIYRELDDGDGFVITAFLTSKPDKKSRVWPR
jgi:hypothetical protein